MQCPNCNSVNPDGSQFCSYCGTPLSYMNMYGYPPYGMYGGYPPPLVPDYLVWSILETCFCCLPFGIAGLVYSINANNAKNNGRFEEALEQANKAKKFLIWGVALWLAGALLYFAIWLFFVVGMIFSSIE